MYTYRAKITKVVDGDTFDAELDLGFTIKVNTRFRLYGVDTPETYRPKSAEEKANGLVASKFVKDRIEGRTLTIESFKGDKYGRWLAKVFLEDGTSLSSILLDKGLAVPMEE